MAEPDPRANPRWLGPSEVELHEDFIKHDAEIERKRYTLGRLQQKMNMFKEMGWAHLMVEAADIEESGVSKLLTTPASDIQAIARLQARVEIMRWLQGLPQATSDSLNQAARELAELEGGTAE